MGDETLKLNSDWAVHLDLLGLVEMNSTRSMILDGRDKVFW